MLLSWLALANCIISHFLFADNENFIFFFYDYFPTCSIIFFANCWNRSAVSLSIGASCPICPATIAATSSMESGFCFCSANASRMAWNIAAVTASPGCSPLSMSFLISRRIVRNTFLIFSISASCSPIFWAFKSCKSCFASARCSGCSFIRSDREAVAISISWFLAVMPFAAVS